MSKYLKRTLAALLLGFAMAAPVTELSAQVPAESAQSATLSMLATYHDSPWG